MRKRIHHHSLGLFFGAIFLLSLGGQAIAGWKQFNDDQIAASLGQIEDLRRDPFAQRRGRAELVVDRHVQFGHTRSTACSARSVASMRPSMSASVTAVESR